MIIDEKEFLETAAVIVKMQNKTGCSNTGPDSWMMESAETFRNWMIGLAYANMYNTTYFSTGGVILVAFVGVDGERTVKASVMPYLVKKYFEALEKEFKL